MNPEATPSPTETLSESKFFVGRQPILTESGETYAYELLFRSTAQNNAATITDDGAATETVLNTVMNVMGLSTLIGKSWGFINLSEETLLNGKYNILPRDRVVIELLENVDPTDEVLSAVRKLKTNGYTLALDDFTTRDDYAPLLKMADIVKVDFMQIPFEEREVVTASLQDYPVKLLAEKVETREDVEQAINLGYQYFQGYYYQRPEVVEGQHITPSIDSCIRLMQALNATPFDLDAVERVVKKDPAMATRLLCYINSAYLGVRSQVTSIGHALKLLGSTQIRKWGSLVAVENLGQEHPSELIQNCLVRALFCEMLGNTLELPVNSFDLYMTGLLSMVDVMTHCKMEDIVSQLDLDEQVAAALLGEHNTIADMLFLAEGCEKCHIDLINIMTSRYRIEHQQLFDLHRTAMSEAEAIAA